MSRSNRLFLLLMPIALCGGLFSCADQSVHHFVSAYGYGTTWRIHLYEGKSEDAEELAAYVSASSRVLDPEASNVTNGAWALNHDGKVVGADPFLLEAIALGKEAEGISEGSYCLCLGALSNAWKASLEEGTVLEGETKENLLAEAKATVLSQNGNTVEKQGSGLLDFGSIGKGLCLNHIKETLEEKGIRKYFVDAGSSSMLFGENSVNDGVVRVNLEDAKGKYFYAKNCAISTSSTAKQGVKIDGKTYSHIIDARTGDAALNYDACCLKGDDAGKLDAYSTIAVCLGADFVKGLEEEGVEGALMKDGKVLYGTEGFLQ